MKQQHEQALLYLKKASEDETLLDEVIGSDRVSDEIFGFHCQQAAEKLIKALLSLMGIRFRKTHDLRELMDLLSQSRCQARVEAIQSRCQAWVSLTNLSLSLLPVEPFREEALPPALFRSLPRGVWWQRGSSNGRSKAPVS